MGRWVGGRGVGLGLQDPSSLWPQAPLPMELLGRQGGGGPRGKATLLPGVGGGIFPIRASFTNPRWGWSQPHARAHTRARGLRRPPGAVGGPSAGMTRRVSD